MLRNEIIVLINLDAHRSLFAYESSGPKFMFDLDTNFDFAYGGATKKAWTALQPAEVRIGSFSSEAWTVPDQRKLVVPSEKSSLLLCGDGLSPRKNLPPLARK